MSGRAASHQPPASSYGERTTKNEERGPKKCRLAILVSGGGTTLQAIIDAIDGDSLPAEIVLVVSSRRDVLAPERARGKGIPVEIMRPRDFLDASAYDEALCHCLLAVKPDLIILAGYLSILGEEVLSAFAGRIMNIHPSLLPSFGGKGFYGNRVHEKVLDYGCKISGATVMFVDHSVDTGPIILQEAVVVKQDDTPESLAARVSVVERRLYTDAIRLYAEGKLTVNGRLVTVTDGGIK